MKRFFLALLFCLFSVKSRETNLNLYEIEPCGEPTLENVSRFKSDIYAVKPNYSSCVNSSWWPQTGGYSKIGLRVVSWIIDEDSHDREEKSVVFVSRQRNSAITSWSIPFRPQNFKHHFSAVDRTMCPINSSIQIQMSDIPDDRHLIYDETNFLFYVDVFSSSVKEMQYGIMVEVVPQFVIQLGVPISIVVGAASPQIYYFKFPKDSQAVTVEASTKNDLCVFFSIQINECPINDLLESAARGIYQTMSKSAFLTVAAEQVRDREFVLVVITTNYSFCHGYNYQRLLDISPPSIREFMYLDTGSRYEQNITIVVNNLEPISEFVLAILFPFFIFLFFVALVCLYAFLLPRIYFTIKCKKMFRLKINVMCKWPMQRRNIRCCCPKTGHGSNAKSDDDNVGLLDGAKTVRSYKSLEDSESLMPKTSPGTQLLRIPASHYAPNTVGSGTTATSDLEASLWSITEEADENKHTLPRMCKTKYRKLKKQYEVYSWSTITVGVFYALPAFQLVLSEQQILNSSGDQDKCYYNFKCAHPLGVLTAFNNIWSNVGYVLLGSLFFFIVAVREREYRNLRKARQDYIDSHGIPQFYGIYYGMAVALILEGFMSGFYHICPTNANFQFDTAFMFIIGGLFLVKIFQKRHPDINANAFVAFFAFAIIIFITLIGLYVDTSHPIAIRITIFTLALTLVFIFFISFYRFHSWPDCGEIQAWWINYKFSCPRHKIRCIKFALAAFMNIGLAVCVVVFYKNMDIATAVLAFFIMNLMIFLVMYIIQKIVYCETFTVMPVVLLTVLGGLWLAAFYFFLIKPTTNWEVTPAESRTMNQQCIFLNFYDSHDIWHFFSASAMFFSFLFLLTLDDGVMDTKRDDLQVF